MHHKYMQALCGCVSGCVVVIVILLICTSIQLFNFILNKQNAYIQIVWVGGGGGGMWEKAIDV